MALDLILVGATLGSAIGLWGKPELDSVKGIPRILLIGGFAAGTYGLSTIITGLPMVSAVLAGLGALGGALIAGNGLRVVLTYVPFVNKFFK